MEEEYTHVRRLVAAIHCRRNVARPPSPEVAEAPERVPARGKSNSIATATVGMPSRRRTPFPHLTLQPTSEEAVPLGGRSGSLTAAPHFSVPKFTVTAPAGEPRRFSHSFLHVGPFTLRRHSNTSLHRSESMVSLACFRQLSSFVSDDNVSGLQSFLQTNKSANVDDRDENGTTALMVACEAQRTEAARLLLGAGAEAGAADADGWTPLALCARANHLQLARDLLDAGAPVDTRDMGGWTPLMWASYKGHEGLVSLLLEHGADVHAHGNYHINSLIWAAGRRHAGVVRRLLAAGARPNSCDKYATSALTWASRAGDALSATALLAAGADPNTTGMYCWTPLLQATHGNYYEIVQMLLEHKPNVNALDKDGYTALAIACKEGYYDIAVALINAGAYINVQDHSKDTCLIHAVKGGHKAVVEALLKKYVDVDLPGKEKKTAVYTAVEKGHLAILKLLLQANPDLEVTTLSGDTPLLRAVRSRHSEMVQILLDRKARINATDRRGDTALHIAMRARSKQIVEILLRNPKHSQLLYKPNKSNETPYNIDMSYPKTILGQIFGARRLNTNEDNENMLGYELYSAALADMLSEPSLSVPITVGLYARWGSGKSFLLNKLREEMKNFARQWSESGWTWSWAVCWAAWHIGLLGGAMVAASGVVPIVALAVAASLLIFTYLALYLLWYVSNRWEWYWPYAVISELARRLNSLLLVLQVVFCHPPGPQSSHALIAQPIRFHFTDQPKTSSQEGEASVLQMIASLSEALECQYGRVCTRLYRAFRPKPVRINADWKWRRACCVPQIVAFELSLVCVLLGLVLLVLYLTESAEDDISRHRIIEALLMAVGAVIAIGILANLYTWGRVIMALLLSPRAQLNRALNKHGDGFLHALRPEVLLLTDMVACLDAFTGQQTRLVVVVDALDSCEQERVLMVLNAIHALCSDTRSPFILILAIDPHIISKAVEVNSRRAFSESNIGGWDYLRNMVQLPFYLQNSALRRVKIAQQTAQRRLAATEDYSISLQRSVSSRRLSATSELMSSQERIKPQKEGGAAAAARARRLRPSESVASSVASGLHRIGSGVPGGAADLGRVLLTDDYFSDVNPRSMRRLMNVLYITGRLLKAFQIEFNWYQLASWVNLTEQWPFRTSWIIYHHETYEEHIDDSTSLKNIYDKIKPSIPVPRDAEPLMELDRDERKLEVFLGFHRSTLLAADLKIFLPFTINLDPYIKKVIKEEQQQHGTDDEIGASAMHPGLTPATSRYNPPSKLHRKPKPPPLAPAQSAALAPPMWVNFAGAPAQYSAGAYAPYQQPPSTIYQQAPPSIHGAASLLRNNFPSLRDVSAVLLSRLSADDVRALVAEALGAAGERAGDALALHNICGVVLANCDLVELKQVLSLPFGEWELFKMLIQGLRDVELAQPLLPPLVRVIADGSPEADKESSKQRPVLEAQRSRPSNVEKQPYAEYQVTLEEQMICGALQTLNEEALEDVMQTEVPPQQPDEESELVLMVGPWHGSPPASPPARRPDPSILKPGGSFRARKHDTVTFKFEDELDPGDEQITFNIDKRKGGVAQYSRGDSTTASVVTLNAHTPAHSSLYEQNSKHDNLLRQGSAPRLKDYFCDRQSTKSPLPRQHSEANMSRRVATNYASRPSSLLVARDEDLLDERLSTRSRSVEDSTEISTKLKNIRTEILTKVNSSERLAKLKERFLKSSHSRERSPVRAGDAADTDDESTPLVSSELSSPSLSSKLNSKSMERNNSALSITPTSPICQTHSRSVGNSPFKRPPQKNFGLECHDSLTDVTVSTDFTPSSETSQPDSLTDRLDNLPVDKDAERREKRTESQASLSNMHEPYNLALLGNGSCDTSAHSSLWRQNAIDSEWNDPESAV